MKCPKCETVNPADSKYCKECATRLDPAEQPSFTQTLETTKDELARGTVFAGRYEIIEELGTGGMGRVYRAHDTKLKEEVALKLIRPEIGLDTRTVERFQNELKIARKITHKNVCRMYDFHEEGRTLYLTMEYVRGEDLKSFIKRSRILSTGTALSITRQVAEGLSEAHMLGVVHRDLKPGNIMIDKEGQAKIMDFGIARAMRDKGITVAGAIVGTPEYMSPEQVEGKEADQRTDIYALGIILFEMVTGRVPFEGETPFSIATKHKTESPPVPKKLAPQIPEGLNKLILRCLEKDRAKRYQTAEELISDVSAVEDSLPTAERVVPKRKTVTHRQVTVEFELRRFVIPASAVLVLGVGGFLLWRNVINRPLPPLPSAKPVIAVLYLKNNTGDPTLDNWKENLPMMLATGLGQSRYLRVLDDMTVYGILKKLDLLKSEKYTPEEFKNIAAEGGATHLLSGNYFKAGGKIVINLSLVDAKTGAVVKPLEDEAPNKDAIFDSVDSLTKKIKVALNIPEKLIDEETYQLVGEVYTRNPQALQYYVEGVKAQHLQDWDKVIPALEKALVADPGFAMAYRLLGVAYGVKQDYVKEFQNKRKAYELRDKVPERDRLFIEGAWFGLREETHLKAYSTYKELVERYPDDYMARFSLATITDDPDERIREYEYVYHSQTQGQIKGKSVFLYTNLAFSYCWKGDYKKAHEVWEEAVNNLPPDPMRHVKLAEFFLREKNLDAARREYEKASSLAPNDLNVKAAILNLDWIKGEPDKALENMAKLLKGQKDPTILDDSWRFNLYMIKGKFKEVLDRDEIIEKNYLSSGDTDMDLGQQFSLDGRDFTSNGKPGESAGEIPDRPRAHQEGRGQTAVEGLWGFSP